MRVSTYIRGLVYGFRKDERGSIAVEAVVILPMMFWTFLALFATFHSYRTYSVNQKAAYTIGDMVSRETNPIDPTYMDGALDLMEYLTSAAPSETAIRFTSVQYDEENDTYIHDWSESRGYMPAATPSEVAGWDDMLPVMPDNEFVMVVETFILYDPPFETGMTQREVHNFVFTRPRYAPRVLWSDSDGSSSTYN